MFRLSADEYLFLGSTLSPFNPWQYAIWPDGTHCRLRDLADYSEFMGDAYEIVDASELDRRLNLD